MRKAVWELNIVILAIICIHVISSLPSGFISGKIYPGNMGESVVAIRGTDSVRTKSKNGFFEMRVRPGNWKIIVSSKEQTKNIVRDNLVVNQGQQVNLGEIRLSE
jgi:hypothetical protein